MPDDDVQFDDEGNEIEVPAKGPAALRAAYDALKARYDTTVKELSTARTQIRSGTLAELLEKAGASKRLAKYVAADIDGDATEDTVLSWLTENGADFGWEPADPEGDGETESNVRRISAAATAAPQSKTGSGADMLHQLQTLTPEQLFAKGYLK